MPPDPSTLASTYADEAFSNARASQAAASIIAIAGASTISGPGAPVANFTAPVAPGAVLGAISVTVPSTLNVGVAVLNASFTCTMASAGTFTFGAGQVNGATVAGGTAVGSRFSWSSAASGAGLVTVTGGSAQAGLGGATTLTLAAGNIALWTFNIVGIVIAAASTVIVVPLTFSVGTGTVAITNGFLSASLNFIV